MRKTVVLLFLIVAVASFAKVRVTDLRVENLVNPVGIATCQPRFSWTIESDAKDVVQTGYEICVASSKESLNGSPDLWSSGMVSSDSQLWIAYSGKPLTSNQQAYWKVRIRTNKGSSEWSEIATFSIGLLSESKWSGQWIGIEGLQEGEQAGMYTRLAARYLRDELTVKGHVRRATAYVAGVGLYEFYLNGKRVGQNEMLTPAPTDYRKKIHYRAYDVTDMIGENNAVGIILGNGRFFPMRQEKAYKTPVFGFPKCRVNIIIETDDGKTKVWSTNNKWRLCTDGPIRSNNEYDGEEYDSRQDLGAWTTFGYDDSKWQKAQRVALPDGALQAQMTPPMVVEQTIQPKDVHQTPKGTYIVDFGQNMAGMACVRVRGNSGDSIIIRYAEKLTSPDELYVANLRNAKSTDIYVCNGSEDGSMWHSTFVYHGFRYIEVIGLANATTADFAAIVVGDEMKSIGNIETSDTILNKVIRNAWWGVKSNYKGMPVDCPQRNERQPWLGDRTIGSLGESFLFNNERLYSKWMEDICLSQRSDGCIPDVAPSFWNYFSDIVTWPAALPFGCDMLYEQFGNKEPIVNSYATIEKWINHITEEYTRDGIVTRDKYGDWCVPPEKLELIHSKDSTRITDGSLISTAYTIGVMRLMEKFATLQNKTDEALRWKDRYQTMTSDFNRHFLKVNRGTSPRPGHVLYPDSVFYGNNTVTANLLALSFGIVPEDCKDDVVKNVVKKIIDEGKGHVTCGLIGISWLLRGLSDNGFADVAYLLATNASYPSWGYMAENGATTIWELWNGDKADPAMNSGNHVMLLGDLLTWCYQYLGGIRHDEPAYKHIILRPAFEIQDCFSTQCSYESPYGKIVSNWKKNLTHVEWDVEIPCNTTADVCLPDGTVKKVGSGTYHFSCDIPATSDLIVKDEFLYDFASFPQCHASTITELKNGDLVAAYFGGKHERNPDVCIWVSRKPKGADKWSEPILAGDGVFELGTPDAELAGMNDSLTLATAGPIIPRKGWDIANCRRKACWNPVLFTMPDGEILLFYKVGLNVADWTGWLVSSRDGGKTWSEREPLPKGFIGPVKNKPEQIGDRLICGSSTEPNGWKFHVEIYDTKTKEWKYVGPVEAELAPRTENPEDIKPIDCIQPSILKLKDGRLQVLMRTRNGKLATSYSSDNGDTWSKVTLTDVPNNQSGTDAVTLRDGRHVLIYNDFETIKGTKKGPRTPVSIAISDDGINWRHLVTLEDSPISQYSYPAIIQGKDGSLHCVYTWRRQRVAYKQIKIY
ncbi:MAG: family 78 glycoside hydrolase catalytic domain [Prevotella sp.]|nr:family 78 glycoside hydrolase catalytic domain [Prevotella sp.]